MKIKMKKKEDIQSIILNFKKNCYSNFILCQSISENLLSMNIKINKNTCLFINKYFIQSFDIMEYYSQKNKFIFHIKDKINSLEIKADTISMFYSIFCMDTLINNIQKTSQITNNKIELILEKNSYYNYKKRKKKKIKNLIHTVNKNDYKDVITFYKNEPKYKDNINVGF